MGCGSSNADSPSSSCRIIRIDHKLINTYIDKLPLFIIQKVKKKFNANCSNKSELNFNQFKAMYEGYLRNYMQPAQNNEEANVDRLLGKLYDFYTDVKASKLTFREFGAKYAIINKCDEKTLANIMCFLYSNTQKNQYQIDKESYKKFIDQERKCFCFQPTPPTEQRISNQVFYKLLNEAGFSWQDYRKRFSLIEKDDLPFQAISRGLIDMEISDFVLGAEYYILSSKWFERWAYYYQGVTQNENENKSTKIIKRKPRIEHGVRKNNQMKGPTSGRDISIEDNTEVKERPLSITFDEIQGQYRGQLKENIRSDYDIKIISSELWQLFKKTMATESEFKRTANSPYTLELYPKSVYFFKTDQKGKILDASFQLIMLSLKKTLKEINPENGKDITPKYYFVKNFGDNIWNEQNQETALGMCSANPRFIVVQTKDRIKFNEKYFRKKKTIENITYGDKVFSFFSFNKTVMPAYILRLSTQSKVLIHYIGFNFRYELQIQIDDLSIDQEPLTENIKSGSGKKMLENDHFSFKGLQNIGNTCFINSIIQCLIASPILESYLTTKKFQCDKQPLLTQISQIAAALLANKKISPVKLKKTIDMRMELFSGYDQHDAQQFLSYLIEELNKQIKKTDKQSQTVLQFLFKGQVESTLECSSCQIVKKISEDLSIVSLPIPEPQYNTYHFIIFPIYQSKIRKIVLRLHRDTKFYEYIAAFEERLKKSATNYIFLETSVGSLKKIRDDFLEEKYKMFLLSEMSIIPDTDIYCFEKFRQEEYLEIMEENKNSYRNQLYFDYLDPATQRWLYGRRLIDQSSMIEIMNQDNSFSTLNIKGNLKKCTRPLGTKTKEMMHKKIMLRRYDQVFEKMEFFGFHYMIAYPKEVTYRQLQRLIDIVMENYSVKSNKKSYSVKICEINKQKCLYCKLKESELSKRALGSNCCILSDQQKDIPLIWIARQKKYQIFVDWSNPNNFNSAMAAVQMDSLSLKAERMRLNNKIQIQDCLKLYQQPQSVEMQCEKCKHRHQKRTQIIKYVPHILILHMKQYRIGPDKSLIKMQTNLKWIQFLDISNYSVSQKNTIYELYAYVKHIGTSQSGHYTCAVKRKHPFENKKVWVNFDDEVTTIMDGQQNNIDSAYLLFFKRIDMPNSAYINFTEL